MLTKEDYMKLSKERLAELLVEKDSIPVYPSYPTYPGIIYEPPYKVTCTTDSTNTVKSN